MARGGSFDVFIARKVDGRYAGAVSPGQESDGSVSILRWRLLVCGVRNNPLYAARNHISATRAPFPTPPRTHPDHRTPRPYRVQLQNPLKPHPRLLHLP